MGSKTVAELIEFLQTQPQDLKVLVNYDGYKSDLNCIIFQDIIYFGKETFVPDDDGDYVWDNPILFQSKSKD